jgi:hypothetical protein
MNIPLRDYAVEWGSNLEVALNFRDRLQGRLRGFLTLFRCIKSSTIPFDSLLRHFEVIAGYDAWGPGSRL